MRSRHCPRRWRCGSKRLLASIWIPCFACRLGTTATSFGSVKARSTSNASILPLPPTRFSGGLGDAPAFERGDDHVGVHHIAEDVVEGGKRSFVLGLAQRGVAVADHDGAKVQHAGVPRRALAA